MIAKKKCKGENKNEKRQIKQSEKLASRCATSCNKSYLRNVLTGHDSLVEKDSSKMITIREDIALPWQISTTTNNVE